MDEDPCVICRQCNAPFAWRAAIGQRQCWHHPGVLEPGDHFAFYRCCGLPYGVIEAAGQVGVCVGFRRVDDTGCTPCDHLAPWESATDTVTVLDGLVGTASATPSKRTIPGTANDQDTAAIVFMSPFFWQHHVRQAIKDQYVAAVAATSGGGGGGVTAYNSWLPRYMIASEFGGGGSAAATASPDEKRAVREEFRRRALGVTPRDAFLDENEERCRFLLRLPPADRPDIDLVTFVRGDTRPAAANRARIQAAVGSPGFMKS